MDTDHIPNHQMTAHSPSTLEKIRKVPIGGKLADMEQTFGCTYRRLDPDKPSPTVTRSGYRDFIHPYEDRMLTVRELACLQTFLVASCITDEVESRLGASMLVRQKYITSNITGNEHEKRKFVNRIRAIVKLVNANNE